MAARRTFHRTAAALGVAGLTRLGVAASADAAVFTVTNRADAGAGSLRDAIISANAAANPAGGPDEIHFNIPGAGPNRHVIHLGSDLPTVTDPVDIRGYSQPGAVKAAVGVPAVIKIVLDAQQAANGLVLQTDGSLVRGLVVHTAAGAAPDGVGIRVEGDGNRLEGNYLGLDGTNNNTPGIAVASDDNVVQGNRVGTDAAGAFALPNLGGIDVTGAGNVVGGVAAGAPNVVSGNTFHGISVRGGGDGNRIQGNLVGTDAAGLAPLGNAGDGIEVVGGNDNTIGGLVPGVANLVAFNDGDGVAIESGTGNTVVRNAITENDGLGIDLEQDGVSFNDAGDIDAGANGVLNVPELDAATTTGGVTTVDWRVDDGLPLTRLRIDFYANGACDPSGSGEGETFLGTAFATTNADGDAGATTTMFNAAAVGQQVAATATVAPLVLPPDAGETSELSLCEPVV